jgi:integrase
MATLQKRNGNWRAIIRRKGFKPVSQTWDTKEEAKAWAAEVEGQMRRGLFVDRSEAERTTLNEALDRYLREVTPTKKSAATEANTIKRLQRHPLALRSLATIRSTDIALYRDERLKTVSPSTARLDLALLSHLFTIAIKEWGLPLENPVRAIRMPKLPPGRDRRLQGDEEDRLLRACRASRSAWLEPIVKFAIETAMRMSEILDLVWADIDLDRSIALIRDPKNGEPRKTPLSTKALAVLKEIPRSFDGRVFPIAQSSLEHAFRNACVRAEIEGLRFHDLRHEATSRLFEKGFNVMEAASITGHKTLQMLKRYTHLRAEDLVKRLG